MTEGQLSDEIMEDKFEPGLSIWLHRQTCLPAMAIILQDAIAFVPPTVRWQTPPRDAGPHAPLLKKIRPNSELVDSLQLSV